MKLPAFDKRVWVLFVGMALNQFGMSIVMPFISIYLFVYQGESPAMVGFAMFFSAFVGAVFQLVGGEACDRFGRRTVFVTGLILLIGSFLLLGWAVSVQAPYLYYLVLLSLTRIATGLFRPIPNVIAADIVPAEKRTEAFAILRVAHNIGFATGPIIGGLMAIVSYSSMFYLTAITSTLYLGLVLAFINDTRACRPSVVKQRESIVSILGDRTFMVFTLLSFLVFVVYSQMYTPLSMYSKGFAGLSEPEIGLLLAINGIMVVSLQYFVTRVADRYRLTFAMSMGVLLYAAGFGLVSVSHGFAALAICIFLITMGELWFMPAQITLAANLATGDKRGRYMGFSGLMTNMGSAVGPLIGGLLLSVFTGSVWVVWLIVAAAGLACATGFIYLKRIVPAEKDTSAVVGF